MIKFNAKNLGIVFLLGIFLIGAIGVVSAQQTLPKGGNSLETAIRIEPGSYKGGSLDNKEMEYFYITDVEFGQEIDIKATFVAADVDIGAWAILGLYDKDGIVLSGEDDGFYDKPLLLTISQTHRDRDLGKYYIQAGCDGFKIASYSLEVSLTEPSVEDAGNGISVGTETPANGASAEGLNWALILGIIVIIAIIAYLLLKKKKKKKE